MYSLLVWRLHWFGSLCLMQESDIFLSFRELLGDEKKGGEIVVSWTLWCFNLLCKFRCCHKLWYPKDFCCNFIWYQRFVIAMVLLHTLVFWFILLLLYVGFQCWKTLMQTDYSVFIPSSILFMKTNRGRMVWFYVLYCYCYTLVLSGFIMV